MNDTTHGLADANTTPAATDKTSQPTTTAPPPPGARGGAVVVKKYANRRLYNTESSIYITLDTLADMVREGRDFVVYDAKTGEDITRSVLTQIIVEEESKGRALLPTTFLRQLIGFYGDSMQSFVPRYLEQAMASFTRQQEQVRRTMQSVQHGFAPFIPLPIEEIGKQNMAMMERAMSLFSPFPREAEQSPPAEPGSAAELAALRAEVESLRGQLAQASARTAPSTPAEAPRIAPFPTAKSA